MAVADSVHPPIGFRLADSPLLQSHHVEPQLLVQIRLKKTIKARFFAILALALVVPIHVWVISAGWMNFWPQYTANYSLLADAFLHGQTNLRINPPPALLTLSDPYDPVKNRSLRLHDASLYHGKYYMYWGPVPAILEAPFLHLLRRPIGDQFVVFAFAFGLVLVSGLSMLEIRQRCFPDAPPWTVGIGVLLAGLSTPIPFILARAAVYEAAIIAGQFFLISGIYFAFTAFKDEKPGHLRLLLASACWAMAVGSRASLVIAIFALSLLVAARLCFSRQTDGRITFRLKRSRLAAFAGPLLVGALLLGTYNQVRFGTWHEFGQKYQLAAYNLPAIADHLFARVNAGPAIYAYSIKPLALLKTFPFVQAMGGPASYPAFVHLPPDFEALEPAAGILWCTPFLLFALIPIVGAIVRLLRSKYGQSTDWEVSWMACCLTAASVLGVAPALFLIGSTMRYMADLTPALMILALVGWWQLPASWPSARRFAPALFLAIVSVTIGILLGVIGYQGHFPTFHPHYLGL